MKTKVRVKLDFCKESAQCVMLQSNIKDEKEFLFEKFKKKILVNEDPEAEFDKESFSVTEREINQCTHVYTTECDVYTTKA